MIQACDQAIAMKPKGDWYFHKQRWYRESRALVRALTENISGALEDLAFVIAQIEPDKAEPQEWIKALKALQNPFVSELLVRLRY